MKVLLSVAKVYCSLIRQGRLELKDVPKAYKNKVKVLLEGNADD